MRILVTGAAGFIGSHLVRELERHGHDVKGIDREDGDLREDGAAAELIGEARPEVVVHLAAKVGRQFGEDAPRDAIVDNAWMTLLVARACSAAGARLAYASTSEVYGDQAESWCIEDGPMVLPHNVYGLSKRWGEEVAELYAAEGLLTLRFSMPYGPGLPPGRGRAAIINFLDQARKGEPIPVHRGSERSWCWIGDTVRGVRLLLERNRAGAFNIGRDDDRRPLREVAALACRMTGAQETLIQDVDPPERQTVVKRLSTAKLSLSVGWEPQVSLEKGMEQTLDWLDAAHPLRRSAAEAV